MRAPCVVGVVVRRGDEETAGVLDAIGRDPPQDDVLLDALLGRQRVLDRVASAGVQQPVEATAGALGEVAALDQHDVEAAKRGVPRDSGAGGATADHQHLCVEVRHLSSLVLRWLHSSQSNVRVTAFFQYL
jgi:hypothetical protein